MKKHCYILLILVLLGTLNGISQTFKVNGITSGYIPTNTLNVQGDSLYDLSVTVHLLDSINVAKILIEVGNSYGGSNIHNGEYNCYDTTLSTPSTVVYERNNGMITFKIKNVVPAILYYKATTYDFQSVAGTPYIRQQ
jgi:hypothetical protein